jgi:hypothetical protein
MPTSPPGVFTIDISEFMIELKDGAIKNVGPSTKRAAAKLFDVSSSEVREFGDKRVKCVFEDEEGNEVQVALFPEAARDLRAGIEDLEADSRVFE